LDKAQEETIAGYDRTAAAFACKNYGIDMSGQQQRFLEMLSGKERPVLDLGCGPGRDTLAFRQQGYRVVGADLSAGMLAEARERVPGADFVQADMLRLPFADSVFGGVWACASFLHLPKSVAGIALAEMRRVLADDGALFLGVKRGKGESWNENPENGQRFFFAYYLPTELWNLVLDAGFEPQALAENVSPTLQRDGTPVRWINLYARPEKR
jgi:ubiquinone/menaquinone biosynthesis C-methylase UbiE